ncbi:Gfo/Idh/MocA family protein [Cohnella rhizosphaerae]|uniref:Gfo/Idh/MocA family oxidoreductase n=1 Tax=Cohnella rhizosphaerae TaxID=1457232 RepID=A0A9X4L762_9BACL|nr:Gfo/Idh/MocA family oxidoreductase [Cohnella rhizosphaerae]MDG0814702.1 Gfo/Idh/MocA family oxidoreductase [Cohnella rhizosphaerae]
MIKVGVIGYGHQVKRLLGMMQEMDRSCRITAIADVRHHEIRERMIADGGDPSGISFYGNADDMLDNEELDGVFVGTRCSLHTPMALKVLPRQLPLYLEKPVATTMEDLVKLRDADALYGSKTVVSFPLRVTHHVQLVKEIIDSGKIGTVEHVQAVNNVNYGNIYYHGWFRDETETQGLFVQKSDA